MSELAFLGLSKAYGPFRALSDVSLALRPGRACALMGENGAGKSTLIKLIAGIEPADRMTLRIDGEEQPLRGPADAAAAGFRFIHQELNVVPQLTVAENILLGRRYPTRFGLVDWGALARRARAALAELGVDTIDVRAQTGSLSTGDRMLVRIAAALVDDGTPPRLYVLDEPTAALTAEESERLFAVIARLKAMGAAVLYVSHRMDEVMAVCEDVAVLRDGEKVMSGEIAATSRAGIIEAMTGRSGGEAHPARAVPPGDGIAAAARQVSTRRVEALDFELRAGEILGIAGLAEAGQSEILRLFLGLERPRTGRVELDGAAAPKNPARAWASKVAYVPRERRSEGLAMRMGVRPNTVLPHLSGLFASARRERRETRARAEEVRLRYGDTEQPVWQLSGGNQQKVLFARALAGQPTLLLLDEPTRGVDVGAKFEIHSLIRRLSARGCAVLMASTDLPELLGLSDRILVLRDGRQGEIVDPEGMGAADLLSRIYAETPFESVT